MLQVVSPKVPRPPSRSNSPDPPPRGALKGYGFANFHAAEQAPKYCSHRRNRARSAGAAGRIRDRRVGGTDPLEQPHSLAGSLAEANIGADRTAANFFYRIPALTYLGNNVVLASWDGRPGSAADAPNPNSIVQRRSTDGGQTLGPVQVIAAGHVGDASGPQYGYSDPSYIYDAEAGKVFALFVYSKDQGFFGSQFGNNDADRTVISSAVIESSDGGVTWSQPRLITNVTRQRVPDRAQRPGRFHQPGGAGRGRDRDGNARAHPDRSRH